MLRRQQILTFALAALLATPLAGCAGVCPKVTRDLREFDQAAVPDTGWDVALSMPLNRLDKLLAPQVKGLPKFGLSTPKVAGVRLPRLQAVIEAVRVKPARTDFLGFAVRVSLRASNKRILVLEVEGQSPARFDPAGRELRIALDETRPGDLKVRIGSGGTKALSSWLWKQIPKQVRQFTPRGVVDAAVQTVANEAVKQLPAQLDRHAPDLFSKVAAIELDFSSLPISDVQVISGGGQLEVLGRTNLPGSRPLAKPWGRASGVPKDLGQLRLSGAAAAALANQAIADGQIPERWNREGEADAEGEFRARVGWSDGKRPLKVELFATEKKDCAHLRLAATPKLAVEKGGSLRFSTQDAQLEKVLRGNLKVRTAIAFSGVGRRTFSMVERVASGVELDAGVQTLRVRTRSARADAREVVLGFDVVAKK